MEEDSQGFLGTFKVGGMAIAPCFGGALFVRGDSPIYHLVVRTADVMLEERMPKTIDDVIDKTIEEVLDVFQINHHLFERGEEVPNYKGSSKRKD